MESNWSVVSLFNLPFPLMAISLASSKLGVTKRSRMFNVLFRVDDEVAPGIHDQKLGQFFLLYKSGSREKSALFWWRRFFFQYHCWVVAALLLLTENALKSLKKSPHSLKDLEIRFFLPGCGSILFSIKGGSIIGKVFQCHKILLASWTTFDMHSQVSESFKHS